MKLVRLVLLLGPLLVLFVLPLFVDYEENRRHSAPLEASTVHLRYSFLLENTSNAVLKNIRFTAFAPVQSSPFQQTESIQSNVDFQIRKETSGNRSLVFQLDSIPPFGRKVINVTADVKVWGKQRPGKVFSEHVSHQLVESDNPILQPVLSEIESLSPDAKGSRWADAVQAWLYQHIKKKSYHAENRGALYALSNREGDCTELMSAFIALVQSKQVAVLGAVGFPVDSGSARLRSEDLHNWVYVAEGDDWYSGDAFNRKSLFRSDHYVAFGVLKKRKDLLSVRRFSVSDSRIQAVMR